MDISAYKALAIKSGSDADTLIRRPLTYDEYAAMNEAEKNFHLNTNSRAVDAALAAHEAEIREATNHAKREVEKINKYEVEDVPALANMIVSEGAKFLDLFPQFVSTKKDTDSIVGFVRDHNLLPELDSFITAFKSLAHSGEISIDASKTGLSDDDTLLTGVRLQEALQANPLLLAKATPEIVERRKVMRMGPQEFAAWEREQKGPAEIPPIIKQQIATAFSTLAARHPDFRFNSDSNKEKLLDYLNSHASLITAMTVEAAFQTLKASGELDLNENVVVQTEYGTKIDYAQVEAPRLTDKQESLAHKVSRMDADEFKEFIDKPANRRAVDAL